MGSLRLGALFGGDDVRGPPASQRPKFSHLTNQTLAEPRIKFIGTIRPSKPLKNDTMQVATLVEYNHQSGLSRSSEKQ